MQQLLNQKLLKSYFKIPATKVIGSPIIGNHEKRIEKTIFIKIILAFKICFSFNRFLFIKYSSPFNPKNNLLLNLNYFKVAKKVINKVITLFDVIKSNASLLKEIK